MNHPNIPPQVNGAYNDIVSMCCTSTSETAFDLYESIESRLKSVNQWDTFSDKVKAKFTLFDAKTKQSTDRLKKGNLIRIDIPGIGNPSGSGYDWTKIIDIQIGKEDQGYPYFLMTISPCPAPDSTSAIVAHFFKEEATNTFIVRRLGSCIFAEVHGRNEIENTSEVPLLDTLRNKAVAIGSKYGLGSLNWLGFTQALLEPLKSEQ